MGRGGVLTVGAALVLVALAYLIPYVFLRGVDAWYGSFLFWVVFGLATVGLNAWISHGWKD